VTLRTWLPRPEYDSTAKRNAFYASVIEQAEALPGVAAAGYTSFLPLTMPGGIWQVDLAGDGVAAGQKRSASLRYVTPRYLEALGVPVLSGRGLRESDTPERELVAVVSAAFARRLLPGRDPLGARFEIAFAERTIVGVVGDVAVRGLGRESEPQVYLPSRQVPDGAMLFYDPKVLVVRAEGPLEPLAAALRAIVERADPNLPITDLRTLDELVAADTAPRVTQLAVLGAFSIAALLLAGLGLNGLLAYTVSSRTREIGVRVALGASQGRVVGWIVRHALSPAAAGLVVGLALAAAAARSLGSLLYGVRPMDPVSLGAAAAIALLVAALGAALPARRALRLEPTEALRSE